MKPVAITLGDPAGIGPELVARALAVDWGVPLVVYGDRRVLERAATICGVEVRWEHVKLVEPHPLSSIEAGSAAVGAALVSAIASGILKSGSVESESMADGFADASFTSPFGICRFRAIDHQSTLGTYVGRLARQGDRGGMVDWRYVDGASVMPPDNVVRQLRPG